MTGCAQLGLFGAAMAAEAGRRVDATVDAVAGQVVAPVGHAPPAGGAVFQRGLEALAQTVTIAAIALLVAHGAHGLVAARRAGVAFPEKKTVAETLEGKVVFFTVVAIQALAQVFALVGMRQGELEGAAPSRARADKNEQSQTDEQWQHRMGRGHLFGAF